MVAPGETLEGAIPVPSTYPNPLSNNVNMQPMGWTRGEGERWAQNVAVGSSPDDTPETPPEEGGGAGFSDDFTRSNRALDGDNGWFKSDDANTADFQINSNKVVVPTGATIPYGFAPILHTRDDSDPNVADVSFTVGRSSTAGNTGLYVVSDDTFQFALGLEYDGSAGYTGLDIITNGAGGPSNWDTNSGWSGFVGSTSVVRLTYNNTTKIFTVYQGGVQIATVDVQAALDDYYGPGTDFPDITAVPNAGFMGNADVNVESFDNIICA